MERTRVADMAERHCGKLSKGYRQRVGLAQALLHNPDVLILDEPTAGLDPKQIIETRKLIKDLAGDHTVILSTHILPEVSQTCQRVVIINKGKVVAVDTPDNLTVAAARIGNAVSCRWTRWAPTPARRSAPLAGVTGVTRRPRRRTASSALEVESEAGRDVRRELAAAVVGRGWGLLELRPMRMSLEDVFLTLTTRSDAPADAGADAAEARMSNILAIARKELKAYFASPIAYVVIGFFALMFGFFFYSLLLLLRPPEHADGGPGRTPVNVNEQLIRPVFLTPR